MVRLPVVHCLPSGIRMMGGPDAASAPNDDAIPNAISKIGKGVFIFASRASSELLALHEKNGHKVRSFGR
jgi:hypothetical protein